MAITYRQATGMVRNLRGRATMWKCRGRCGRMAAEWCFVDRTGSGFQVQVGNHLRWISENPVDYQPLCRPCRRRWVKARDHGARRSPYNSNATGRPRPLLTHCPRGHEYTGANTYFTPSRKHARLCRACRALHQQERKARERASGTGRKR